jgi:hypothetical protein
MSDWWILGRSFTYNPDHHNITEMLLKVVLNTITVGQPLTDQIWVRQTDLRNWTKTSPMYVDLNCWEGMTS